MGLQRINLCKPPSAAFEHNASHTSVASRETHSCPQEPCPWVS